MSNAKAQRSLVIVFKTPKGLSEDEAHALAERVKAVVQGAEADKYKLTVHEVIGAQRLSIGPYAKKTERIEDIENLPKGMTAEQAAKQLGFSTRQIYRYRALLKSLCPDEVDA
jgi:hypothetical protein